MIGYCVPVAGGWPSIQSRNACTPATPPVIDDTINGEEREKDAIKFGVGLTKMQAECGHPTANRIGYNHSHRGRRLSLLAFAAVGYVLRPLLPAMVL